MLDLYSGAVSYVHDGSDSSSDTFSVVVSDSTNAIYQQAESQIATAEPTTIHIEVSKVEDGTPLLRVNRGIHFLQQEAGTKVGSICFLPVLKCTRAAKVLQPHLQGHEPCD